MPIHSHVHVGTQKGGVYVWWMSWKEDVSIEMFD
jgi:hypothetical protein